MPTSKKNKIKENMKFRKIKAKKKSGKKDKILGKIQVPVTLMAIDTWRIIGNMRNV